MFFFFFEISTVLYHIILAIFVAAFLLYIFSVPLLYCSFFLLSFFKFYPVFGSSYTWNIFCSSLPCIFVCVSCSDIIWEIFLFIEETTRELLFLLHLCSTRSQWWKTFTFEHKAVGVKLRIWFKVYGSWRKYIRSCIFFKFPFLLFDFKGNVVWRFTHFYVTRVCQTVKYVFFSCNKHQIFSIISNYLSHCALFSFLLMVLSTDNFQLIAFSHD